MCREGFASLHGIGVKRVRRISILKSEAKSPYDNRGKHLNRGNAKSEDIINNIDNHIQSFPYKISHYGRQGEHTRYLSSDLSIMKMYCLFLEKFYPSQYSLVLNGEEPTTLKCEVTYHFYLKHFHDNYNYKFGAQKRDLCVTCSEFKAKFNLESVPALKRQYQLEYEVHKKKAAKFYDKLNEMTNLAKEKNDVDVLCFDFKQNMPLPHLQTSDVFYMRQLWLYVVSM